MDEPDNHSAVKDCDGYVWVRVDDYPDPSPDWNTWWPEIDGPCSSLSWKNLQKHAPLKLVPADRAAEALTRLLKEVD